MDFFKGLRKIAADVLKAKTNIQTNKSTNQDNPRAGTITGVAVDILRDKTKNNSVSSSTDTTQRKKKKVQSVLGGLSGGSGLNI